jgi:hypothetical protein
MTSEYKITSKHRKMDEKRSKIFDFIGAKWMKDEPMVEK